MVLRKRKRKITMTTSEVAKGLAELCRKGLLHEAIETYYADDIVSVEGEGGPPPVAGLPAILEKTKWWEENMDTHGIEVVETYVNGDQFMLAFKVDFTEKASGKQQVTDEIGLYTVRDSKIAEERFFFTIQ